MVTLLTILVLRMYKERGLFNRLLWIDIVIFSMSVIADATILFGIGGLLISWK